MGVASGFRGLHPSVSQPGYLPSQPHCSHGEAKQRVPSLHRPLAPLLTPNPAHLALPRGCPVPLLLLFLDFSSCLTKTQQTFVAHLLRTGTLQGPADSEPLG